MLAEGGGPESLAVTRKVEGSWAGKEKSFQAQEAAMKEFHGMYDKLQKFNKRRPRLRMSRAFRPCGCICRFDEYIEQESARLDEFRPPDYGPMFEDTGPSICGEALTSLMPGLESESSPQG